MGQPTRGKTALNRLRQIDIYVALAHANVLSCWHGAAPLVVDVGFGAQAWTTLEMRARWLRINARLCVVGIEIDPVRVAEAQPFAAPPDIDFRLGGFNVADALGSARARIIRCCNVLRQYEESAVGLALAAMAEALEPGGILIEGTSNPTGRMVAFDVYQRVGNALQHQALVFGTNFRGPIAPTDFQAVLPKRLIHHMRDAAPAAFFRAWQNAFALALGAGLVDVRGRWLAAARILHERFGYPIDLRLRIVRRGFLALHSTLTAAVGSSQPREQPDS